MDVRAPELARLVRRGFPPAVWWRRRRGPGEPSGKDTVMLGHGYLNALKNAKSTVYGPAREKVGTLGNIFMDVRTGDADFVSVHLGLFGTEEALVSLDGAVFTDGHLQVRFPKDVIRHAPNIDPAADLGDDAKHLLDEYYAAMDPGSGT